MTRHTDAPGASPNANDGGRSETEREHETEHTERAGPADPPEATVTLVNYGGDKVEYAGESVQEWVLVDRDALVSLGGMQ